MAEVKSVELHHGGRFKVIAGGTTVYTGGTVEDTDRFDPDFISFIDLQDIILERGYPCTSTMYYKLPGMGLTDGLRQISSDRDVLEMVRCYEGIPMIIIYVVRGEGPLQMVDKDGNVVKGPTILAIEGPQAVESPAVETPVQGTPAVETPTHMDTDPTATAKDDKFNPAEGGGEGRGEDGSEDDNRSWMFEDFEGVDDDEIFKPQENPAHAPAPPPAHAPAQSEAGRQQDTEDGQETKWWSDHGSDNELNFAEGSDEDNGGVHYPDFNDEVDMANPELTVGMKFKNVNVFRQALREWQVRKGYDLKFVKNEGARVTAVCKAECGFRIHASPMQGERTFQVKSLQPKHNCGRSYNNHLVNSRYLSNNYLDKLRDSPGISISAFRNKVKRDLVVDVSKNQLYRAKREAKETIEGDSRGAVCSA